jgi:hypothetical protein
MRQCLLNTLIARIKCTLLLFQTSIHKLVNVRIFALVSSEMAAAVGAASASFANHFRDIRTRSPYCFELHIFFPFHVLQN